MNERNNCWFGLAWLGLVWFGSARLLTHEPPCTGASVRRVTALQGAGHCPHDETPELVNPLMVDFAKRVVAARAASPNAAMRTDATGYY